jgi:tRNA-splicing ligase RtcB
MKKRDLIHMGVPKAALPNAILLIRELAAAKLTKAGIRHRMRDLIANPESGPADDPAAEFATTFLAAREAAELVAFKARPDPAPWTQWGRDIDEAAKEQMAHSCDLPIAFRGALMPDAHLGYGLPIGGVLATEGAVIPYAVGVDIACRMKMSVFDLSTKVNSRRQTRLIEAIEEETRFGKGSHFRTRRQHDVLDRDWTVTEITKQKKDTAWSQLGSSGGGNHFVEFGLLTVGEDSGLDLAAGEYMTLLSHSGSRGVGAGVSNSYSKLARAAHPDLPKALQQLAWLDMDSEVGQEYWAAMNLMGEYAAANHDCIHRHIGQRLGAEVLLNIENHHNFAWKETHFGREVIVHRKGATPAGEGVLGVIPGSMSAPAFVVRGKGNPESLASASHGAGCQMSRSKANKALNWKDVKAELKRKGVTLISAGLDEAPMAYKDIHEVMDSQRDLVEPLASFQPTLVKMAGSK